MAVLGDLTWGVTAATVYVGQTVTVPINSTSSKNQVPGFGPSAVASITSSSTTSIGITGNSVGTLTIPAGTVWTEQSPAMDMETINSFTLTVLPDDPKVATESMWADLASRIKTLGTQLGGLSLVPISRTDYDNLATKDPNTLYIITGA